MIARLVVVFSCIALAWFAGCSPAPSGPAPTPAVVLGPPPKDDHSLALQAYLDQGMPAIDKPWSSKEMAEAAKVLAQIAQRDPEQLPRLNSRSSGTLFARLTSRSNLDAYRDRRRPLSQRMPLTFYFQSGTAIFLLYSQEALQGKDRGGELVELVGLQLEAAVLLLPLADELLVSVPPNDPRFGFQIASYNQTKSGLAVMVKGSLQTITEKQTASAADRLKLVGYLHETLPKIVPALVPHDKEDCLAQLEALSQDAELQELQPALSQLRDAVNTAVKEAR